jgi:hypothetical protein
MTWEGERESSGNKVCRGKLEYAVMLHLASYVRYLAKTQALECAAMTM